VNLRDMERMLGIERTVPPAPTRADVDRMRRKKLARRWRGVKASRRQWPT